MATNEKEPLGPERENVPVAGDEPERRGGTRGVDPAYPRRSAEKDIEDVHSTGASLTPGIVTRTDQPAIGGGRPGPDSNTDTGEPRELGYESSDEEGKERHQREREETRRARRRPDVSQAPEAVPGVRMAGDAPASENEQSDNKEGA